jgi:hypothetical protein
MNVSLSWIGPANENGTLSAQEPEQTKIDMTMTAVTPARHISQANVCAFAH